jgi:urease accessory protein
MNNLQWLETRVDKLRAVLQNGFPPLEKEGQGGFAGGCFRQVWAANTSPSIPLFLRGMSNVGRESTVSRPASCLGLCFILVLALPANVLAHSAGGEALGFFSGLAHPISGLDHVLAMVAVGLWGAQLGAPALLILPVTFPMVMAFGGMLGLMGVQLPGIEVCIALSAVALGLMVLREAQPNLLAAAFLVGFFAIFHGHAHGTELPQGANGMLYSIGFVIATGTLHAAGIAIGLVHRWPAGRLALRAAGALVSIAGVVFLWRAIA